MNQKHINSERQTTLVDRLFRKLVRGKLDSLRGGWLQVIDSDQTLDFGNRSDDLQATITVLNPSFYRRIALDGGLGAAESLMDGEWICDDLTALIRIFIRNMQVSDKLDRGFARGRKIAARFGHWLRRNTKVGSRRNIGAHYDLGNEFYSLFLDRTMSYSSGIFESEFATMHDASVAKLHRVCRKLNLQAEDHLLEIGSGWGSLAIHAAQNFGCRVTTTTISQSQFEYAKRRVEEEGLEDQVTVLCKDYRELTGTYDKLVSIEMIEAVGHENLPMFFSKCKTLLKPDGLLLLQSIVITEERYDEHLKSVDFIRRYIFPGGCLPSIASLTKAAANGGGLRMLHLEDIAPHYAETLRRWHQSFCQNLQQVRALGFDQRFIRMWKYYLCYCEAAFEERQVNNVQMLLAKRDCRLDFASGYENQTNGHDLFRDASVLYGLPPTNSNQDRGSCEYAEESAS